MNVRDCLVGTRFVCVRALLAAALLLGFALAHAEDALDRERHFEIAAQALDTALLEFSRQADVQVLVDANAVRGRTTSGVRGTEVAKTALSKLLADSGLTFRIVGNTVEVRRMDGTQRTSTDRTDSSVLYALNQSVEQHASGRSAVPAKATANISEPRIQREELEEIVVTGTHIRGVRPVSMVVTISEEQIRLAGHHDLGEVIRALPQNFSGGQNPGVALGATAGGQANDNITGSSGFNLRGLGPDATLTLLNGTRLSYDGIHQATDVSTIPVAAIERVEVLLDGASAIYGSDAVAGVANVVLKRDYQGVELSARYGESTSGGYEQQQYAAVAGQVWDSGGFLVAGDYADSGSLLVSDRDYLSYLPNTRHTVQPALMQKSGLLSGHQKIGRFAELNLDVLYADREMDSLNQLSAGFNLGVAARTSTRAAAPSVSFDVGDWSVRLLGSASESDAETRGAFTTVSTGAFQFENRQRFHNTATAAGTHAEGPIFAMPAGTARLSVGAGYRKIEFERTNLTTGVTAAEGASTNRYGYGELHLPLLGEEQNIFLARTLSLNGALRYENYSSFGEVTTPKLGLIWGVVPGFDLKASWGKSFKIPTLLQEHQATSVFLFNGNPYGAPAGRTVLQESGGNTSLAPERAKVLTAGLVFRPEFLPGFTLELGWFDIDYTDRVVNPLTPALQALINPAFAEFVTLNPTSQQQSTVIAAADTFSNQTGAPYNPANVHAILHNRFANAAEQRASGFDLTSAYTTTMFGGQLSVSGNGSWLDGHRRLTSLSTQQSTTGVIYFPPKFRGRLGASWARQGWTLGSYVNYIDGVTNTNVTPRVKGNSMTTLDVIVDYLWNPGAIGEIRLNLSVHNALNQRPPFLQPASPFFVNYDSTNYSAIGRVVSASVTKKFGGD